MEDELGEYTPVEDRSPYDETLSDIIKNSTVVVSEIW